MIARIAAAAIGVPMLALVTVLIWGALRGPAPPAIVDRQSAPSASLSEQLSEGLIEIEVYLPGDRTYLINVRFSSDPTSTILSGMPPDVTMATADMHMGGFSPPLELISAGVWQAGGKVTMAGNWIISVGYGQDFAELPFRVK